MVRVGRWGLTFLAVGFAVAAPAVAQSGKSNPLKLSPHHATASVADLGKEADWYERVLGFQRNIPPGGGVAGNLQMYQMTIPGYRIDLIQQKGSTRQHEASGASEQGWLHVVFKSPDIDAAYKYLVEQATDVKATKDEHSVLTRLTFHDPEGNELEIVRE